MSQRELCPGVEPEFPQYQCGGLPLDEHSALVESEGIEPSFVPCKGTSLPLTYNPKRDLASHCDAPPKLTDPS